MKISCLIKISVCIFISFLEVSIANAQDTLDYSSSIDSIKPKDDLLKSPVMDLLDQHVSSPSKSLQRISDAPGTVTAYSSSDISNLGYYTLADLAAITPGFSVNYQFGEKGFEIRGETAGGFNNNKQVLLLIDGIPITFARSNKLPVQEDLPLMFGDRVEFLKGPVGSLYGVNALKGVVSIFSKEPVKNGTIAEGKFSGGTSGSSLRFMGNLMHRSNKVISTLSAGYYTKNPSKDFIGVTNNPYYRYWDQSASFFIKSGFKIQEGALQGLGLGMIMMQRKQGIGQSWFPTQVSSQMNNVTWTMLIPYLKYEREFNKKLTLYSFVKANKSLEDGGYITTNNNQLFTIYRSSVINYEMLGEVRYKLNRSTGLLFGLNYDKKYEQGNPGSYAYHILSPDSINKNPVLMTYDFNKRSPWFNTFSVYTQMEKSFPVLSGLTVTGGLHYDLATIGSLVYDKLSPKLAIVQKFTPRINVKLMSGQSMRAPGIKDFGEAQNSLSLYRSGNVKTPLMVQKGEIFHSSELAINYTSKSISISVIGFYNVTHSEIASYPIYTTFYNPSINTIDTIRSNWPINISGSIVSKGMELDFKSIINSQFKFFMNASYAFAKNQQNQFFIGVPLSKVNLGIMHSLPGRFNLKTSLILKYISGYIVDYNALNLAGGSTMVDANVIVPITDNFNIEVQARNLLNQKVKVPPVGIPLPGINFMFTLAMRF